MRPFYMNIHAAMLACVCTFFASSSAFSASMGTVTGNVTRGTNPTSFTVSVTITGISATQRSLQTGETSMTKSRIQIFMNDVSQSTAIPYDTASPDTNIAFQAEAGSDPTITAETSGTTYTGTFSVTIRENQSGALTKLLAAKSNAISINVNYNEGGTKQAYTQSAVSITAAAVVAQTAPVGFKAVAGDSKVVYSWVPGSATFIGASGTATTGTLSNVGLVAIAATGQTTKLPELIFTPAQANDVAGTGCTLNPNFTDGEKCVTCDGTNGYLDIDSMMDMDSVEVFASKASASNSKGEINGLTIGKTYFAFAVNMPGSLQQTACYRVLPYEGQSLAQINGETKENDNPRCFIATAAYGSPLHKNIKLFTWFRSTVLLKHDWGKAFVHWYNTYGPPAAEVIADHPSLKFAVRTILWIPALMISLWLNLAAQNPWAIAGAIAAMMTGMAMLMRKSNRRVA